MRFFARSNFWRPKRRWLPRKNPALRLDADAGSFSFSGAAAGLQFGHQVVADSGSFSFSGSDAALQKGVTLIPDSGSFAFSGSDASFLETHIVEAESGSFSFSGSDAGLGNAKEVDAESGSFSFSGSDVALLFAHEVEGEAGSFAFSGTDAGLRRAVEIIGDSGSFAFTGDTVAFSIGGNIVVLAEAGSFEFSGSDADPTLYLSGPYSRDTIMAIYERCAAVTKSDSTVLDCNGFYVGGAGNVAIKSYTGDTAVVFTAVPAGTVINVQCKHIMETSTTATAIVALW